MVYAPQRRHAVASMSSTVQALAFLQHLYAPNALVLICRFASQIHIRAPAIIQPTRSLYGLFFIVTSTNVAAVFFHLLDFAGGWAGDKGIMLDFVRQAIPPSLTRILLLDLLIWLIQVATLTVCYVVNYAPTIPSSSHFPYDDLLLPPEAPAAIAEADLDVESGDQFRQRRLGKGPKYHHVATDDNTVWLEEEEEEDSLRASSNPRLIASSYPTRGQRRHGTPLAFTIPFTHLVSLIFRLPSPEPERVTSGGTPAPSPPATPAQRPDISLLAAAIAQASAAQRSNRTSPPAPATPAPETTQERSPPAEPDHQPVSPSDERLPGGYWTSRTNG